MSFQVGADERTDDDQSPAFRSRGLDTGLGEQIAQFSSPQRFRDFRVDQRQRIVAPLIAKKRDLAVDLELEATLLPVVANPKVWEVADADPGRDGIRRRVARGKGFFDGLVENFVAVIAVGRHGQRI